MTRLHRTLRGIGRMIPLAAATVVLCAPADSLGQAATTTRCIQATARVDDPRRVPLEPTGPAIGADGYMTLTFARSPFGVTVTTDGRPVHRLRVVLDRVFPEPGRDYVAWAATPNLERVVKLGVVKPTAGGAGDLEAAGRVAWNQFMVLVTAEADADVERWQGPVLLTAVSPSSWMHTMRGHGIFARAGRYC